MMQAVIETLFDTFYLIGVIALGVTMILKSKGNKQYKLLSLIHICAGRGGGKADPAHGLGPGICDVAAQNEH